MSVHLSRCLLPNGSEIARPKRVQAALSAWHISLCVLDAGMAWRLHPVSHEAGPLTGVRQATPPFAHARFPLSAACDDWRRFRFRELRKMMDAQPRLVVIGNGMVGQRFLEQLVEATPRYQVV